MTISRATMRQQLKGNRMKKKKKPVIKAGIGKLLENTSPLYSAMKGKGLVENLPIGLLGKAIGKLGKKKKGAMPSSGGQQAPQGMTATPMASATPLKGGGRTKNKKPVVKAFSGLSAKLDPVGMATRVIKKSSPEKFGNFQKEIASKFGGDPNFKKAMKKLGVPTLAAATPLKGGGGIKIQKIPPALAFDLRKEKPVTAGPREGAMTPQGIRGPYKRVPFAKMNKGGMVKRKRSIDGIAQRGKTRAG